MNERSFIIEYTMDGRMSSAFSQQGAVQDFAPLWVGHTGKGLLMLDMTGGSPFPEYPVQKSEPHPSQHTELLSSST
jgi:hypothetical protein